MVLEPLLWPFLSSLVFISVTPFSTSLPPSQQPPQSFAIEPPTSSNRRPWVPDLQSPSLRSFTLHRPLPFASPLQILLRLRFWKYHKDRLASIYIPVKASMPSETARAPTHHPHAFNTAPITSPLPSSKFSCSDLCRRKRIGLIRHSTRHHASTEVSASIEPHAPRATRSPANVIASVIIATSALTDVIRLHHLADVINLRRIANVITGSWPLTFFRVDFCSPSSPYPVFA